MNGELQWVDMFPFSFSLLCIYTWLLIPQLHIIRPVVSEFSVREVHTAHCGDNSIGTEESHALIKHYQNSLETSHSNTLLK